MSKCNTISIAVNLRFTIIGGSTYAKLLHQVSHKLNRLYCYELYRNKTTNTNAHDYIIESDLYTTLHRDVVVKIFMAILSGRGSRGPPKPF